MAEKLEIYECDVCGNIVEVVRGGNGAIFCCGQSMQKLEAKTADEGKEKHVPMIERINGTIKVKVGSVAHPMQEKHYIEWIELLADGKAYRKFLSPDDEPEAIFELQAQQITAREHCNIHGLWEGKLK